MPNETALRFGGLYLEGPDDKRRLRCLRFYPDGLVLGALVDAGDGPAAAIWGWLRRESPDSVALPA
jgi:hypothetical protein